MHCRMFSSIPGLYLLGSISILLGSSGDNHKCLQTFPSVSCGVRVCVLKLPSVENHRYRIVTVGVLEEINRWLSYGSGKCENEVMNE